MPAMTATFDMDLKIAPQVRTMAAPAEWNDDIADADDLASAKGLIFGCLLGLTIWAPVIGYFCC